MEAGIINDDIMEGETTQTVCPPDENEKEKDTDWKRRTLELEEQLFLLRERVNSQTGKIRDAVSKRVTYFYCINYFYSNVANLLWPSQKLILCITCLLFYNITISMISLYILLIMKCQLV